MREHNDVQWDVVGLHSDETGFVSAAEDSDGDRIPFSDADIESADMIRVEFTYSDGTHSYHTVHNEDIDMDWSELEDYVDHIIDYELYS